MRIAVDARELLGRPTGVGRYLVEILRAWDALPAAAEHEFVLCAPAAVSMPAGSRLRTSVLSGGRSGGTLWEQWTLPRLLRDVRADVLFAPAYTGPLRCPAPMVLSIHDVSFAAHPEWFGRREGARRRLVTRLAAHRAGQVLTLTTFSKTEIVKHLGIAADRITVTYAGVSALSPATPDADRSRDGVMRVVFAGTILNRRHVPELIAGFARLAARRRELRLELVGDNRTNPVVDLASVAASAGVADRVHVRSYVSDDQLGAQYAGAAAFVWLSSYEGFGLPPLEALAAGVPVLVLDTPVAREVYGDAAIYVAAPHPDLIADGLERVLFDHAERVRVIEASRARLGRYSWSACAATVLDALVAVGR